MTYKILFILLISLCCLTSCLTTVSLKSVNMEVMGPAIITMPDDVDTIAIVNRDLYNSDTTQFKYIYKQKYIRDTLIQYHDLANTCLDALAEKIENEGYFLKVINYKDSIDYLFDKGDTLSNYPELLKKVRVDAFVFLDYFSFDDFLYDNVSYLKQEYQANFIFESFPEFRKSKKFEFVKSNLVWTIAFEGDSSRYVCTQPDKLYYGDCVYPELFGNDLNHRQLLRNTAQYMGKTFGAKLIPSWIPVERSYYHSGNKNMLLAEKYCKNGEWLKAAEIYNRETNNKRKYISAKAKYNMGLVCEMEGKLDAAIDWMVNSYMTCKDNEDHKFICQQYINILAKRKKEIELLGKQTRNN